MHLKQWINPILVGLLILFSLPIKLPALQLMLESSINNSFPIKLSIYTFFLPPLAIFCIIWNRKRTYEIWKYLQLPLTILGFLFIWMWIGAVSSDYTKIALKHAGRYSIYLLTFFAFLFVLDSESSKKCQHIFAGTFIFLMALTFLDWSRQINIIELIGNVGMKIDLFFRNTSTHGPSSFFENRNPFAIVSISMFFWYIVNLKKSWFLSSLGIITSLWCLMISGSRNGLFTFSFCFLLFLILCFRTISKKRLIFLFIIVCAILTGIIFSGIKNEMVERSKSTFYRILETKNYNDLKKLDRRFSLYSATLEVGLNNLRILGSGPKTAGYEIISNSKDLENINKDWYKKALNSHNSLLTIWIEMGWVGLFAALVFLYTWFLPALKKSPLLILPAFSICVGQIFDYFIWEILFMTFQSFFFAHLATTTFFLEGENN